MSGSPITMSRRPSRVCAVRRPWGLVATCFVLALSSVAATVLRADDVAAPTEGALSSTPWYDPDSAELVPVRVETVTDDSAHRDSRWLPEAQRVRKQGSWSASASGGSGSGSGLFGTGLTWGNLFGWTVLVLILLAVVALLLYVFSKADFDMGGGTKGRVATDGDTDEQTVERMKQLPAELRRTGIDLREEALRLMEQSEFEQAVILLFGHQLLLLDRAGLLRLSRGKTNGRYVRETRAIDPALARRLDTTVTSFERSYFGRHSIDADEFARLWENNVGLEKAVRASREVAA